MGVAQSSGGGIGLVLGAGGEMKKALDVGERIGSTSTSLIMSVMRMI